MAEAMQSLPRLPYNVCFLNPHFQLPLFHMCNTIIVRATGLCSFSLYESTFPFSLIEGTEQGLQGPQPNPHLRQGEKHHLSSHEKPRHQSELTEHCTPTLLGVSPEYQLVMLHVTL